MKRIIIFVLVIFLAQCTPKEQKNTMHIKGNVEGLKRGTIYLQQFDNQWNVKNIDSVVANGSGVFEFKVQLQEPEIFALQLNKKDSKTPSEQIIFFGEPKVIDIQTRNENFALNANVYGSDTQKILEEYNKSMRRFSFRNVELLGQRISALKDENQAAADSLASLSEKNEYRKHLFVINYALLHKNSHISPYITLLDADFISQKYLDSIYNSLPTEVANAKYGKLLAEHIKTIKNNP